MSRLEYVAEAEPKLLALRDVSDPVKAYERLTALVGHQRFETDCTASQKPCPKDRDKGVWAVECWEATRKSGDVALRVYGGRCQRKTGAMHTGEPKKLCGCVVCDIARDLGVLEAVAKAGR